MKVASIVVSFDPGTYDFRVGEILSEFGFEKYNPDYPSMVENKYMKLNGLIPRYCLETTSGKSATLASNLANFSEVRGVIHHEEFDRPRKIFKRRQR